MLLSHRAIAQDPDSSTALFSLAEAERNFSRSSVAIGRINAFVENLADESVIFQPEPTNGKQFYSKRKPSPFLLTWEPEFVDIAASEDFGVSHGPWEITDYGPRKLPQRWGYYVSIWKKQKDGAWKVVVDMGNGVETKPDYTAKLSYPKGSDKKRDYTPIDTKTIKASLIKMDQELSGAVSNNIPAYLQNLSKDARVIRMGHFPATTQDSIKALLSNASGLKWSPIDGDVSSSGDLAYIYGSYEMKGESGSYLHVWKKQPDLHWKILVDVHEPKE